jgi:hypothetical protein
MTSDQTTSTLYLQVDPQSDMDPEELDQIVRHLRRDLSELEVESVEPVKGGPVPAGAKGVEVLTLGSLAVVLLPAMLPRLIEFLQDWLMRGSNRSVKLKLQVQGNSVEVEYSPGVTSSSDIDQLVGKLTGALGKTA